ncbi:MAG: DUF4373 domain-containing protein [Rectinemataceae bacterium]
MGRAESSGIGYFPVVTEWDQKLKLVRAKYKLAGIGCIVELWKAIYAEGYALRWDEDAELLFADENNIDLGTLRDIVNFSAEKGIFDRTKLVDNLVLTSHGIQKQWLSIVRSAHRKTTEIDPKICLLTAAEISLDKVESKESDGSQSSGGNDAAESKPPEEIHQSKGKESKEKKEEQPRARDPFDSSTQEQRLLAYCTTLAKQRGAGNVEQYARRIMREPDIVARFEAEFPPKKVEEPPLPDPGPCPNCGGERTHYPGNPKTRRRCLRCGSEANFDEAIEAWVEEKVPVDTS